jgi:hypothetical protein
MVNIPDDLNKKMKERKDINWSRVASLAFAAILDDDVEGTLAKLLLDFETLKEKLKNARPENLT